VFIVVVAVSWMLEEEQQQQQQQQLQHDNDNNGDGDTSAPLVSVTGEEGDLEHDRDSYRHIIIDPFGPVRD
jgi:hypothetical protein